MVFFLGGGGYCYPVSKILHTCVIIFNSDVNFLSWTLLIIYFKMILAQLLTKPISVDIQGYKVNCTKFISLYKKYSSYALGLE